MLLILKFYFQGQIFPPHPTHPQFCVVVVNLVLDDNVQYKFSQIQQKPVNIRRGSATYIYIS